MKSDLEIEILLNIMDILQKIDKNCKNNEMIENNQFQNMCLYHSIILATMMRATASAPPT